jgi:hypothetical protein
MVFRCPKCANETFQEAKYCPNCGCPLQSNNNLLREKIAETRHNEMTATLSCGVGIALFLIGFFIRPNSSGGLLSTGFFNFFFWISGIALMVTMAILTTYYSMQRKKLIKELKW